MNHMISFLLELAFSIVELSRYLSRFVYVGYLVLGEVQEMNLLVLLLE